MSTPNPTRRDFVKRIPYVAPAVLSLAAAPEYAKAGSVKPGTWGGWERERPRDEGWDFGGGKHKDRGPKDKGEKRGGKGKEHGGIPRSVDDRPASGRANRGRGLDP
jgi:hypothetical protein